MKTKMIKVMSCNEVVRTHPEPNTALLRILDSEWDTELGKLTPLNHPESFSLIEHLTVDDIIPSHLEYEPTLVLFENQHLEQLRSFFEKAKNCETVIFHCSAGISRSSAMGILFARYLNRLDLECVICLSHWIRPNSWILSFEKELYLSSLPEHLIPLRKQMYRDVEAGDKEVVFQSAVKLLKASSH